LHRVIKIGIGKAALALQPRNKALKEDAVLLNGTQSAAAKTVRSCESVKATM
jgi:hypothetical protein